MGFSCPYCGGILPPPTRKCSCPYCKRTIFARTRPNQSKQWVREEDLPIIEKEWSDQWFQKQPTRDYQAEIDSFNECRKIGVVKTIKIYSAHDDIVCPACEGWHEKIIKIEHGKIGSTLPPFKFCQNINRNAECGCRCYWRPEKISIE